jgi:signal transduction histidine kinase
MAMFRLVQEGLTNVVRHARPSRVDVELACRSDAGGCEREIVLRVVNDGVAAARREACTGLGIAGIRERIEALGGRVRADSIARASFVLEARLPLRAA